MIEVATRRGHTDMAGTSPVEKFFPPVEPAVPWKEVPSENWTDWRWQMQNRITTVERLKGLLPLTNDEIEAATEGSRLFRLAITPYYFSLIDRSDPGCPVRKQAVPGMGELLFDEVEAEDPLAEDRDMPVPGITHRYPDRVLFYVSPTCAMYCRHCTRKRKVSRQDTATSQEEIRAGIEYIRGHQEVRDVIVSGGDPLTMGEEKVEWILGELRTIPHVEIIRIGTRTPVTMPQRITDALVEMLARYHPLYVNTHFNHPRECTLEAYRACTKLADAGIPIGNQMVLLKGVNDDPLVVRRLNQLLLMMRVRPYYIYMCDLARGIGHFRTTVKKGLEIIQGLRGWTSGLAVPHLVIDAPGGGGKIPLLPEYVVRREGNKVVLKNYAGNEYVYYEGTED